MYGGGEGNWETAGATTEGNQLWLVSRKASKGCNSKSGSGKTNRLKKEVVAFTKP